MEASIHMAVSFSHWCNCNGGNYVVGFLVWFSTSQVKKNCPLNKASTGLSVSSNGFSRMDLKLQVQIIFCKLINLCQFLNLQLMSIFV
jgi:hypothetical protein